MRHKKTAKGQLIVFMGAGKGKTAAALGVSCRQIAHGWKVIFVYFTAPQQPVLGEIKATAELGNNWRMVGIKSEAKDISYLNDFTESVNTPKEALTIAQKQWLLECSLLVLDNISYHLDSGSIDIAQVLALIDERPPNTNIILTGRSFPEPVIQRADLVTEFRHIK